RAPPPPPPPRTSPSNAPPAPVAAGTPGASYGLATANLPVDSDNEPHEKQVTQGGDSFDLTWLEGEDGVTIQPGAPAIPKQVKDVTVNSKVLRGVGLWSAD